MTHPGQFGLFHSELERLALPIDTKSSGVFRPVHYLGSKLRLIEPIERALDAVSPRQSSVCDLFAGSGTVSLALSKYREVIAADIQEYSRVLCSALLAPSEFSAGMISDFLSEVQNSERLKLLDWAVEPLTKHESSCILAALNGEADQLCDLLEYGSIVGHQLCSTSPSPSNLKAALIESCRRLEESGISPVDTLAIRHFGGLYFSYRQAMYIDVLLAAIHKLPVTYRDTFLAAVLSTASDVVNTVGKQFAQPIKPRSAAGDPKHHLIAKIHRDRNSDVLDCFSGWLDRYKNLPRPHIQHQVIRGDFHDVLMQLDNSVSVVYADPPYTRDHYSRYYHVLETLCLRDDPEVSTVVSNNTRKPSRGVYRSDRHQSPFCIKSEAPIAFNVLFGDVRKLNIPLVLSYSPYAKDRSSRPRLMTVEALVELARKHFSNVAVESAGKISHNKLNTTQLNFEVSYEAEIFIICKP